jgi:YHS domain-containing protein
MHSFSRRDVIWLGSLAATSLFTSSVASIAADSVPLAINGYDPVAYFTEGKPVRGLPEIEYEWDEHFYRFSSAEHRERFKADPVQYAPQFANFCAAALAQGRMVEANPEYWLISDGKLYIFGKSSGPDRFQRDLAGQIAKANENQPLILKR